MNSQALIPQWIARGEDRTRKELIMLVSGNLYLAALAQVSIPLPFTPVPITGQTFGVATLALLCGGKRSVAIVTLYLLEGFAGLPVFADASSGFFGPTLGYLLGMVCAGAFIGTIADRRKTDSFMGAFFACCGGSLFTFGFGLLFLSRFVSRQELLGAGLIPFLPGDLIKNATAAFLRSCLRK